MDRVTSLLEKISKNIDRLEPLFPPDHQSIDFDKNVAFRWVKKSYSPFGRLQPIQNPTTIAFEQLVGIEKQINEIRQNTEQFLANLPANNLLLTGARGTGKSSLIKATLASYQQKGLKMVEIDSQDLEDLPELLAILERAPYSFIIFCDDLSFEAGDPAYKPLKAMLDGSLSSPAKNILLYATSNRRHLLPESMQDNLNQYEAQEIHPQEAIEEKISLSERFGLWISFYPPSQKEYLAMVKSWLYQLAPDITYNEEIEREALQFTQRRGSRSGRIAYQFTKDFVGRSQLMTIKNTQKHLTTDIE
ncbi:ATP-binding protein [Ignatzschineria cameli]|uniref:AAA family ATPase n=2 Tax=Bacteria TaxID=2 RepID=A0A2U2AU27_9GAMM|nr:ATP-binding protein [Ignatzschineria cameli]PWD87300.1 AAA family ATPase [Ignatzschineria cameli]PWD88212.1 AAA family ATPase [Ignatzschineria cameli]PWD91241.1 AAA family ATPase [Ignatzschineria cameli]PWD92882.1 AAA family ATPase [Ignatzschineria cameli]PWD93903.1 AAA family ATPase [Ignatzschineria cameli]